MSFSVEVRPLTLYGVEGHLLRCNDVVFQPALPSSAEPRALALQRTLVFFGGDIQNFSYLMDHDDKVIDYRKWCLETTALRLSVQFPACHVVVIKPSRVVFDHISCYDNFVESNHLGIPKHYYQYMALRHLDLLLQTLSRTIRQMDPDVLFKMLLQTLDEEELQEKHNIENGSVWQYKNMPRERKRVLRTWQKTLHLDLQPLKLVAFSKGCVVLNQFLYEFHYARGLAPLHNDSCIIERIREMYWLDSGNCGRQNVYITSTGILRTLTDLDIVIHVHVSMYMTEDENRPWIAKQFNEFIAGVKAENGNVLHFRHVSPTDDIVSHFEVLMQFKYSEKKHLRSINSPRVRRQRKPQAEQEPPAPAGPEPARAGLRRKRPSHNESIGLCLVNLHDSPYLGLQISVQKHALPLKATEARLSCPNLGQTVYPRRRKILSTGLTRADIPVLTQMPISAQTTSAPSANSAEPSMSVQTPSPPVQSTSAQKPPASRVAWSSGQLPSHKDYTAMLLNEICYSFSEEEALASKNSPYYNIHAPVIALPNHRNSLRMHVYAPEKEIYVPKMYSHHYVVNRKNENGGGEQLPSFFPEEGAPPAAGDLEPAASGRAYNAGSSDPDPELEVARLTASSNFTAARSGTATGPVDATSSPRSDDSSDSSVSNPGSDSDVQATGPNPNISDSDSDDSVAGPDPNESEHSSGSGTSSPIDRGVGSQSASRAGVQSTARGSQMASSSQDSIAPRAGTSGARVRARDIDDEPLHRYNLRKRIRRSYDESIFHPEYE